MLTLADGWERGRGLSLTKRQMLTLRTKEEEEGRGNADIG